MDQPLHEGLLYDVVIRPDTSGKLYTYYHVTANRTDLLISAAQMLDLRKQLNQLAPRLEQEVTRDLVKKRKLYGDGPSKEGEPL